MTTRQPERILTLTIELRVTQERCATPAHAADRKSRPGRGALWDLRDHAYDHPKQWAGVGPDDVFQVMAQIVERAIDADVDIDWMKFQGEVTSSLLRGDSTDTQV